uniref:Uncharacterized protein n=1 Tax=Cucumis melo TaxID=3656 RepID=A0A9I9EDX2_CUCME
MGGTVIGTSRGGHDTSKIVDSIQDHGINQKLEGKGSMFQLLRSRKPSIMTYRYIVHVLTLTIVVIDKSFGFDTIVEKAQWDINTAHVESESKENGIELLKLMGSYCDKFVALEKSSFRSL